MKATIAKNRLFSLFSRFASKAARYSSLSCVCGKIIHALIGGDEGCRGKDPGPPRTGFFPDRPPNVYIGTYSRARAPLYNLSKNGGFFRNNIFHFF